MRGHLKTLPAHRFASAIAIAIAIAIRIALPLVAACKERVGDLHRLLPAQAVAATGWRQESAMSSNLIRADVMGPAVLDAFALAIIADGGAPAYPGLPKFSPDPITGRRSANEIAHAMGELLKVAPNPGSYVSESNYFEHAWQESYWEKNYARLRAVKARYDAEGLFYVHHGVGSEEWSADGFTRLIKR
jgi:hypothetical protein